MIRSFNDHAANERTFLAWVRTGLSAVALGIVVKKGSLLAVVTATASSPELSGSVPGFLDNYGEPALVGVGIAAMAGAAVRFVRTARRIDEQTVHSAGIVRLASALLCGWRKDSLNVLRRRAGRSPPSGTYSCAGPSGSTLGSLPAPCTSGPLDGHPNKRRRAMRFILVNHRTPFGLSVCTCCGEQLSLGYLREMSAREAYCNYECYERSRRDRIAEALATVMDDGEVQQPMHSRTRQMPYPRMGESIPRGTSSKHK